MSSTTTPDWLKLCEGPMVFTMVIPHGYQDMWLKEIAQEAGGRVRYQVVLACNAMAILADQIQRTKDATFVGFSEQVQPYLMDLTEEELRWMEKHSHQNTPFGAACRQTIFERLMFKNQ